MAEWCEHLTGAVEFEYFDQLGAWVGVVIPGVLLWCCCFFQVAFPIRGGASLGILGIPPLWGGRNKTSRTAKPPDGACECRAPRAYTGWLRLRPADGPGDGIFAHRHTHPVQDRYQTPCSQNAKAT